MKAPPVIAIVGAGPAACTLAALLARRGHVPLVFDDGRRPELLVGESLIPAVVPILRDLGIEERVAAISLHKPGVTFLHNQAPSIHFNFAPVAPLLPTYAYNVERQSFDALLKSRAIELGARFIPCRAGVHRASGGEPDALELDETTMAALPELGGRQPDLLVDASGRARVFSRLLDIGAERGKRDDTAIFAHFEGFQMPEPAGQVLITRLSRGWSWRIPLPGDRMSFGIVVDKEAARAWGATPEARLHHALENEPLLKEAGGNARRVSPVAVYNNYQLIGNRASGPGWVTTGDAFGFVDPMLSSGLFLAMESAVRLDTALADTASGFRSAMARYDREMRVWYQSWGTLIDHFYDGSIFSLYEAGHLMRQKRDNPVQHAIDRTMNKHIARMASGATTRSRKSQWLLARRPRAARAWRHATGGVGDKGLTGIGRCGWGVVDALTRPAEKRALRTAGRRRTRPRPRVPPHRPRHVARLVAHCHAQAAPMPLPSTASGESRSPGQSPQARVTGSSARRLPVRSSTSRVPAGNDPASLRVAIAAATRPAADETGVRATIAGVPRPGISRSSSNAAAPSDGGNPGAMSDRASAVSQSASSAPVTRQASTSPSSIHMAARSRPVRNCEESPTSVCTGPVMPR